MPGDVNYSCGSSIRAIIFNRDTLLINTVLVLLIATHFSLLCSKCCFDGKSDGRLRRSITSPWLEMYRSEREKDADSTISLTSG